MAIPTLPPPSAKAVEIGERVKAFLEEHIIPAEHTYHQQLDEGKDRCSFMIGGTVQRSGPSSSCW